MLDPSNITTPPPPSSNNDSGVSDSVLGVAITFAVLVPVAIAILAFWWFRRRANRISEGKKEYLRALENQDKARKFGQPQQVELESTISRREASLSLSNNLPPASNQQMPFPSNLSPASNRQMPFSNNQSRSSEGQLPFSNTQVPTPSYVPFTRKVSIYEMDATSVHGTGKNKALPKPR